MTNRGRAASAGRGLLAGFVGITAMTSTLWAERRARRQVRGPIDYDASNHVVRAASALLSATTRRWRRDMLASSLAQHAVYALAVARAAGPSGSPTPEG